MAKPASDFSPPTATGPCPCGTGKTFGECCEPLLLKKRPAENAEQLMRSRYSAHVVRNYEHLHRTYLDTSREPYVAEDNPEPTTWTRLVIHSHEPGPRPDMSFVDFTAYFQKDGGEEPLHEKAEFKKIDGTWFYIRPVRQGAAPARAAATQVGRNDPCTCGSGKKYKKCHGK